VKERLVICNKKDTDGGARVTRDEERVLPVCHARIISLLLSKCTNTGGSR